MPRDVPLAVVLAGPNGAGKSTIAPSLLGGALAVNHFVNADDIAVSLDPATPARDIAAGRMMLDRLRQLARDREDFAFETTLSGRSHARWLSELRGTGYRVHLFFLALPEVELAVARVRSRVRSGGHDIPEDVIRRRYRAGLRNLFEVYLRVVDSWSVFDNAEFRAARLLARQGPDGVVELSDHDAWEYLRRIAQ